MIYKTKLSMAELSKAAEYSISPSIPAWAKAGFFEGLEQGLHPLQALSRIAASPFFDREWIQIQAKEVSAA